MVARRRPAPAITKATRKPLRARWPPDASRVRALLDGLQRLYPDVECELQHDGPFQLLCATILSAQCTDERVNQVTPNLFRLFPDAALMAEAPLPVLEDLVRSTGFYRQKAKNLKGTATLLRQRESGDLPRTIDELRALPGVARKTANVVLGSAYNIAAGIVVDTHVQRLSLRLGMTRNASPEKIERDLMEIVPQTHWIRIAHQLIWHGRRICFARKPNCDACGLAPHCPSAFRES